MKKNNFINFSPPVIDKEEIAGVIQTLRSDWITTGPKAKQFEKDFKHYVGAKAALAVSSGTAALHLALLALKIGKGDEVITTPVTFCSGVHVIEHVGAKPIFADVDPSTMNIHPGKIEQLLKKRSHRKKVKAIIVVHFAGHPCDMNAIMKISRKYKIPVIEDAAHALPAKYKGRMVGSFGNLTAFSFYATKNLTTGEGGMLTGPASLLKTARMWSLHGMSRDAWNRYSAKGSWYYEVIAPGFKYNLSDIQSAIGLAQLRKLSGFHKRRLKIIKQYHNAFSKNQALQLPAEKPETKSAWHLYTIRLNLSRLSINRDRFISELKKRGIGASVHFIPVHLQPYYRKKYGYKADNFPIAYEEYKRLVSLPLSPALTDSDITRVIHAVKSILRKHAK